MLDKLPGKSKTFWVDSTHETEFNSLQNDLEADVVVIGGGITGLTTGLLLKKAGKKVAVIEADKIVKDVSAATTAKVSAHNFYSLQMPILGPEKTLIYAKANKKAVETVAHLVSEYNIDCDFRRVPCYFYTESKEDIELFKTEAELAPKLGLPATYTTDIPTSSQATAGLIYENQVEFHPRKYLLALASEIPGEGSYLFEDTRVLDVQGKGPYSVITNQGTLTANQVVVASSFPVYDPDDLYQYLKITRSYILAYYGKEPFPDAMFICINPFHTYRSTPTEKGRLVIIAGEHQGVGEKNTVSCYKHLEKYVRKNWAVESIEYHWVNQDNATPDGLPAIGETSKPGIYLATGFNGWGMTHGTTSALLITDLIIGKENPLKDILDPLRFKNKDPVISNSNENLEIVQKFSKGEILWPDDLEISDLSRGESRVLEDKFALYRDEHDHIHKLQAVCPHRGCILAWNDAEKTWDCPCHGARFNQEGRVIHGPAVIDLKNYSKDQ